MQNLFGLISIYLASITGITSISLAIFSYLIKSLIAHYKLTETDEIKFKNVLNSDNIIILGKYLDDTLGRFNIHEYASNTKVQNRVDKYLEKIQNFIGTNEEIIKEEEIQRGIGKIGLEEIHQDKFPKEFNLVLKEVRTGEPWNALARLRRYIEKILVQKAKEAGFTQAGNASVRKILDFFERNSLIDKKAINHLSYSISICNRAIHGVDVSVGEAEEAIFHAGLALEYMGAANLKKA